MSNELQSLSMLFQNRLFRIPDYQRGYAWTRPQLVDFWNDLVNLHRDRYHYTGLLSLKPLSRKETESWGDDQWLLENGYKPCHIVDGQQRITTFIILLYEIVTFIRGLEENKGKPDKDIILGYEKLEEIVSKYICRERPPHGIVKTYLFDYEADNPSAEYMRYKIFDEPFGGTINETYYTKNLKLAKQFFADNIKKLYDNAAEGGLEALQNIYKKLTQRMMFNLHEIDDEYDVFVAFETMNNRGKKLTNLELLKNRLIYLTTLYDDSVYDERDKAALRKKINDAWKEVYFQLGRNKDVSLSDDDFLRAHWSVYFKYSRRSGDDYIKFLLSKFSSSGIFEKMSIPESESEELEEKDGQEGEKYISRLQPEEIEDYVNSLKSMAQYWYDTFFPSESKNLSPEEERCIDQLNRIGIGYFRPLVTVLINRRDISEESRINVFKAIERFIFVDFRMGNYNGSYGSSDYYRAAHQIYFKEKNADELFNEIYSRTTDGMEFAVKNFVTRIERYFSSDRGYYAWNSLKYFFFEYEATLASKNKINRFCSWEMFTKSESDKVSIEHILPQTPSKYEWRNTFRQFTQHEIQLLSGALGNLLPLSQSVNSALQNDSFEEKKRSTKNGRRGYENGSHSEIEVSKVEVWTADEIYDRTEKLLNFIQERWDVQFSDEQRERLTGISFVKDGRTIPPEIEREKVRADCNDEPKENQRLLFWTDFIKYADQVGRSQDIARQKAADRAYYDVHIGAEGYHLFFAIPYGKRIRMGIYTYNAEVFERLHSKKEQIEAAFGEKLNWGDGVTKRSISVETEMDVFDPQKQREAFEWIINQVDGIKAALMLAEESLR